MKLFLILCTTLIVMTGCQTTTNQMVIESRHLLNDNAFPDYQEIKIESEEEIFALDQEAKDFIQKQVAIVKDPVDRMETLVRLIFDRSEFNLLYMGSANTVAKETFQRRAANCLSMSIMTYALAKEAGFSVRFQDVQIPEYWTRRAGYSLLNGHINLMIMPREPGVIHLINTGLQVDFDPQNPQKSFPKQMVTKQAVTSMFYNNKGADALLSKSYTKAYAYFKKAAILSPNFISTWINLGILYRLVGDYESAESVYLYALQLDEDNLTGWENLAFLYEVTGRSEKASAIVNRIERVRSDNPFHHFIQGEQSFENGEFELALKHYRDALRLDKSKHEIYFGLAKAYYELGDVRRSQLYFKKAKDRARSHQDQERYQGKLDLLSRDDSKKH
ncbi:MULTISPECIES: tetratricopeptide repeat protein [Aliiglaciecola]|uniref:tetratricopeptide repeat protein n=1 Tax=Aliiglaciecola TaxID=1406885 RepID=UPI001C095C1D|nr:MULTISPECIES: tetratricopeptide repeat protein [Aliiglaciecola]MBU2877308.1 tetratricopeptide repeat protein [Aliiglaciecola lipolytica]MDO6711991.1 tetratricopeptide repeat protein [Aliiglaciecola sp. 2_MG-2023]MDO6753645.1 tetratricopeptide repeat protein [Aliiglaciecola sp. 1_MG-2023]